VKNVDKDVDKFLTIRAPSRVELKIQNSKFIALATPCQSESEAESILDGTRKNYYDATHHCFAYRVDIPPRQKFRYSDAGEPTGTAGRPIYDRIEGNNLTNLIIIVVRYFGGIKLGTGGLTRAYSAAAAEAIEKASVIEKYLTEKIRLIIPFHDYGVVERIIRDYKGKIVGRGMIDQTPTISLELRLSFIDDFRRSLIEATSGRIGFGENA
jgi:uncharacterized YigZ family protein